MGIETGKILEVKNKEVLVVGIARSGVATARFLAGKGTSVTLTDIRSEAELAQTLREIPAGTAKIIAGRYPEYDAGDFDFLVVSPGVPLTVPPVRRAFALGVPVLSELELAKRPGTVFVP